MKDGGFHLRKWKTNDPKLRKFIIEDTKKSHEQGADSCAKSLFNQGVDDNTKVLGISWDTISDEFVFSFDQIVKESRDLPVTKRNILRISAMFFDPIGVVSLVVLQAKYFFKELCLLKVGWDETVTPEITKEWKEFLNNLAIKNEEFRGAYFLLLNLMVFVTVLFQL